MTSKRYLLAPRIAPLFDARSQAAIDDFFARRPTARVVRRTPVGRRVVHMAAADAHELSRYHPHFIIEEDRELERLRMPGLPEMAVYEGPFARELRVIDSQRGTGIEGASIYGIGQEAGYRAITDPSGSALLQTQEADLTHLIVSPRDTYWSRVVNLVSIRDQEPLVVALDPLSIDGQYSWGHRLMQFDQVHPYYTGRGVRIAIIDSGVSNRLEDFRPRGGWNTLDGGDPNAWNVDEKGHGTHCAGSVCAGHAWRGIRGGAPGAEVYSIKVFPGGYLSDLVEAVEWCIQNGMHVLNVSFGGPTPSEALARLLEEAWSRGIITIAASGNQAQRVAFPAAFPTVIAVGAIGRHGTFPADSGHSLKIGPYTDPWGILFSAAFSNVGREIAVCAPGVAIPSTVPTGYASWDGTSMACPMITALTALVLEACPMIRTGDASQPEAIRTLLAASARDLGMPAWVQGAGLPTAPAIVSAAARLFSRRGAYSILG